MLILDQTVLSLNRQDLIPWATDALAFHGIDLNRVSTVFLAQAFLFEKFRRFCIFDLTNPIKVMEGLAELNDTPIEDQFKYLPLTGLYKKHFSSPRFLPKNLGNYLQSKEGKAHFDKVFKEASEINKSGYVDEEFAAYIAHHMTIDSFSIKSASNRMTGEWIVFHKHEGQNYYLTVASHKERNECIYERVLLACDLDKFPFIL